MMKYTDLLFLGAPLPEDVAPVSFQFHRKYGRRGRITFIPNLGGYSPNCSLNCRMILFSSLEI